MADEKQRPFDQITELGEPMSSQDQQSIGTPAIQPVAPVQPQVRVGERKPLFFDSGNSVSPPFVGGGPTTQETESRTESEFDMPAAAARSNQALGQAEQTLREGTDSQKEGLANQRINMQLQQQKDEDAQAQNLKHQEFLKKDIAKLEATKIDESDWWRDGGTGRTVAAMLALAGGGFVNAIRPGSNNVTEVIYGAIDRYVKNKVAEKNDMLARRGQLLGDDKLAERMLAVDIRKSVLDQGALMAQTGAIDAEFGKTLAKLQFDNVKDLNQLAASTAARNTVSRKETTKPRGAVPWEQNGMDRKRWDRFTQGENKEPGAVSQVRGVRELQRTTEMMKALAASNGNQMPGFGPLTGNLPEGLKTTLARIPGFQDAKDWVEARRLISGEVLKVIQNMNSRLVDSNVERARMENIIQNNDTDGLFRAMEDLQRRAEQGLKDWANEHAVPGVDPNDMVRYIAQTGSKQESPSSFQPVVPGSTGETAPLEGIGEGKVGEGFISPMGNTPTPAAGRPGIPTPGAKGDPNLPERRPKSGEEVEPSRTPVKQDEIKGALERQLGVGNPATDALLRQILLETGDGNQMFGYNVGNLKASGGGKYQLLATNEGYGETRQRVREPFVAYDSLDEGVAGYLGLLRRRYPEAFAAAREGDIDAFNEALRKGGYYTDDPAKYGQAMKNKKTGSETSEVAADPDAAYNEWQKKRG